MSEDDNKNEDYLKGGAAAVAGAAAGWAFAAEIGTMGLTAAGTGLSIGAAPVIAAGAIIGMAGFGIYKMFAGK